MVLLLLCFLPSSLRAASPPSPSLGAAEALRSKGAWSEAEAAFRSLWTKAGGRGPADAALAYGRMCLLREKWKTAEAPLREAAAKSGPLAVYASLLLAESLRNQGRLGEAGELLTTVLRRDLPRGLESRALALAASVDRDLGLFRKEAVLRRRLLRRFSKGTRAEEERYLLALALERAGKKRAAFEDYKRIYFQRAASPFGRTAGIAMRRLSREEGFPPRTLSTDGAISLSDRCLKGGRTRDALDLLNGLKEGALPLQVQRTVALRKVRCLYALRRNEAVVSAAEAMAGRFGPTPESTQALLTAGWATLRLKDHSTVLRIGERVIAGASSQGPKAEACYLMAVSAYAGGRFPETIRHVNRMEEFKPRRRIFAAAAYLRAWSLWVQGAYSLAGEDFRRAKALGDGRLGAPCSFWASRCDARKGKDASARVAMEKLANEGEGYWALAAARWLSKRGGKSPTRSPVSFNTPVMWPTSMRNRRTSLARRLALCGLEADAAEVLAPWFRRHKRNPGAALTMAYLTARGGRTGTAEAMVNRAFRQGGMGPGTPDSVLRAVYPTPYLQTLAAACGREGVPVPLAMAVVRRESGFDPGVLSRAGARGLMQLMPATAGRLSKEAGLIPPEPEDLRDPGLNISLGVRYLADLLALLPLPASVAAYNAGETAAKEWSRSFGPVDEEQFTAMIPYSETRSYTEGVLWDAHVYGRIMSLPRSSEGRKLP